MGLRSSPLLFREKEGPLRAPEGRCGDPTSSLATQFALGDKVCALTNGGYPGNLLYGLGQFQSRMEAGDHIGKIVLRVD